MTEPISEMTPEVPEADAVEQALPVTGEEDEEQWSGHLPEDADEGDAAEQTRVVELNEDDYR